MATDPSSTETKDGIVSAISTISGGTVGGAVGAAFAGPLGGAAGGAIGGLIPLLANIPAAKRQKERAEQALVEISQTLSLKVDDLSKLNDQQFKVISESLLTLRETVEADKIRYLKRIITSSVGYGDYNSYDSILLSRIIRDISAEEIAFLINNFGYSTINIYSWYDRTDMSEEKLKDLESLTNRISEEKGLLLLPGTPEALITNGLLNLGILIPAQLALGVHEYIYSEISVKLIALLHKK